MTVLKLLPVGSTAAVAATTDQVAAARLALGLGNVDDTPDDEKPISAAVSEALSAKAALQAGALQASPEHAPNATAVLNALAVKATLQTGALVPSTTVAPNAKAVDDLITSRIAALPSGGGGGGNSLDDGGLDIGGLSADSETHDDGVLT